MSNTAADYLQALGVRALAEAQGDREPTRSADDSRPSAQGPSGQRRRAWLSLLARLGLRARLASQ